ncbi:response regulator [uncultured Algibacter sp.]|uniref:LytR/AlgR family response regulator transcription factor n=1 Tax=uncultured Algibacter sp. TaxID=298659 RepID=UPI00260A0CF9|nr:response regulator [uncultured Algibacter sp.]
MPSIRTLIIDDEPLARKRISILISDLKDFLLIDECSSGKEAVKKIQEKKPDLIFLDIQMKDMTGFDVLRQIDPAIRPLIIFITAFDVFALKAFDYFAFDYLLKPFKDERFYKSTKKVIELFNKNNRSNVDEKINQLINYVESPEKKLSHFRNNKLPIKANGKVFFIEKQEIKYIQASGYYAEIYTDQKKYLLRESLSALLEQLNKTMFFRIHRSTIVNTSFIKEVIYSSYGEIDVKMLDEKLFRISKTHKKEFQNLIGL